MYRSPNVNPAAFYCYFDPIELLPEAGQRRWADPAEHELMLTEAIAAARVRQR